MTWYSGYEADSRVANAASGRQFGMPGLCRTSSDVASELLYHKECRSCRTEFINFTV